MHQSGEVSVVGMMSNGRYMNSSFAEAKVSPRETKDSLQTPDVYIYIYIYIYGQREREIYQIQADGQHTSNKSDFKILFKLTINNI